MPLAGAIIMRGLASLTGEEPARRLMSRRMPFWETPSPALPDGECPQAAISDILILQRHRSDCWTAGPVIVTLRYLRAENAKREGEREGSDDDHGFCHHGSPLGF